MPRRILVPRRLASWAPWAVVVVGALLRLERYVNNRSLWLDESLLALNIREKSLHGLLGSLDYTQSAPSGFLLIEKAIVDVLGDGEHALRLFPFVASLVGLVLFALVARRLLPPWPALLAITLYIAAEPLVYQSSEAKPYGSDAMIALLIAWLTLIAIEREPAEPTMAPILPLAVAGVAAVWVSYPAVFVLAGSFIVLLVRAGRARLKPWLVLLAPVAVAWSASFLVDYSVTSRNITTVSASIFGGGNEHSSKLRGIAQSGWDAVVDPGGFLPSMRSVAVLCLAVGVVALVLERRRESLVLLAAPATLAIAAAYLDRYPFGGRFSLFLVPFMLIVIARGASDVVGASRRPWVVGLPLLLLLVAPQVGRALSHVPDPPKREHVRPLLERLTAEWRPGDTLYVYRNAQYALRYYAECDDCDGPRLPFQVEDAAPNVVVGRSQAALASAPPLVVGSDREALGADLKELEPLRGKHRVWLLFSHVLPGDESAFTGYLDTFGRRLEVRKEPGAALYLYDLGP